MFHALIPKKENKKQKGRKSIIDITDNGVVEDLLIHINISMQH